MGRALHVKSEDPGPTECVTLGESLKVLELPFLRLQNWASGTFPKDVVRIVSNL